MVFCVKTFTWFMNNFWLIGFLFFCPASLDYMSIVVFGDNELPYTKEIPNCSELFKMFAKIFGRIMINAYFFQFSFGFNSILTQ